MPFRNRTPQEFWGMVEKPNGENGCWFLPIGETPEGYHRVGFCGKRWYAHRLSYFLTHGSISDGMDVLHRCDNPPCINPSHLFEGTQKDNTLDMLSKGRGAFGERNGAYTKPERVLRMESHPMSKMKTEQVYDARRRFDDGTATIAALAREFHIGESQMARIVHRESWR